MVAGDGGNPDIPRRREPRALGKKCGGAIGGAKNARRDRGLIFYEGRKAQFECRERSFSAEPSAWGPADQPSGWHRRRGRGTRAEKSPRRGRRNQRGGQKTESDRRTFHSI